MDYQENLKTLWDFLCPSALPSRVDVIFVFGGLDLLVPRRAAELFNQGYASQILVTGHSGAFSKGVFRETEARIFADEMMRQGVPSDRIILEEEAENTGENVELGMKTLLTANISPSSVIVVAKPFITRRALATFEIQHPNIKTIPCPPEGDMTEFIDRSEEEFAKRLLGEIKRLEKYAEAGFITKVEVPPRVLEAYTALSKSI